MANGKILPTDKLVEDAARLSRYLNPPQNEKNNVAARNAYETLREDYKAYVESLKSQPKHQTEQAGLALWEKLARKGYSPFIFHLAEKHSYDEFINFPARKELMTLYRLGYGAFTEAETAVGQDETMVNALVAYVNATGSDWWIAYQFWRLKLDTLNLGSNLRGKVQAATQKKWPKVNF